MCSNYYIRSTRAFVECYRNLRILKGISCHPLNPPLNAEITQERVTTVPRWKVERMGDTYHSGLEQTLKSSRQTFLRSSILQIQRIL